MAGALLTSAPEGRRWGGGRGRWRRAGSDARSRLPPAALAAAMAVYLTPRFRRLRSQSELEPRRGSGRRRRRGEGRGPAAAASSAGLRVSPGRGAGSEGPARARPLAGCLRLPVAREGPLAGGREGRSEGGGPQLWGGERSFPRRYPQASWLRGCSCLGLGVELRLSVRGERLGGQAGLMYCKCWFVVC